MAAKPGTVFTWGANLSYADPTQVLDISSASNFDTGNPWTDDGVAPDNFFAHEYANYTFKLISDWVTYLDDLDISQVRVGSNGQLVVTTDTASAVLLQLAHTGGGITAIETGLARLTEGELALGVDPTVATAGRIVIDAEAAGSPASTTGTHLEFRSNAAGGQVLLDADGYKVKQASDDADAGFIGTGGEGARDETLYLDNLPKAQFSVRLNVATTTVEFVQGVGPVNAGTVGYNIDGVSPTLIAGGVRVQLDDFSRVMGRVHVSFYNEYGAGAGVTDVNNVSGIATYNPATGQVSIFAYITTVAAPTSRVPVVDATGIGFTSGVPAESYRIDVIVF